MRTAVLLSLLVPAAVGVALVHATPPRAAASSSSAVASPVRSTVPRPSGPAPSTTPTAEVPAAGGPAPLPRQRWGWPLAPRPAVARRFDRPTHQWSAGHRGVDLSARVGQPVLAAGDGVVVFVGTVAGRDVVSLRHAGGWRTTYEPVAATVAVGDAVRRGDRIGTLAATPGHCAPGTCLHWGALLEQDYRDPLALLLPRRVVLLPLS